MLYFGGGEGESVITNKFPDPELVMFTASALPAWITSRATAAVPLVPLTVSPTTLLAVGVTVLAAVDVGTCSR